MLLGFSFSSTMQCRDMHAALIWAPLWSILLPDKMTAKENQVELFSDWYYCSFVRGAPTMCAGGLSVLQEYTWVMSPKCIYNFTRVILMCKHV